MGKQRFWVLLGLLLVSLVVLFSPQLYYRQKDSTPIGELRFELVNNYDLTNKVKENKNYLVINNQDEWEKIIIEKQIPTKEGSDLTKVDFRENTVIILAIGLRSSGGYKIETAKIINQGDKVVVFAKETSPGKKCLVPQMITTPYEIIKLAKINKPVSFEVEKVVRECN